MRVPLRIPIAVKLACVSIIILLLATIPTAFKTADIFKDVSSKREEDTNRSQADARANEVEVVLENLINRSYFFGSLLLQTTTATPARSTNTSERFVESIFRGDRDFISLDVLTRGGGGVRRANGLINEGFLEAYGLDASYLTTLQRTRPMAFAPIFAAETRFYNRSIPDGAPILSIGLPLVRNDEGEVTHIVIANIRLEALQDSFATQSERIVYLVDKNGIVFAHGNEALALSAGKLDSLNSVRGALASPMAKGQLRYLDRSSNEYYISAFSKTRFGLIVLSEAPESIILEPAMYVRRQVFYITGLVLSGALFVIFLFSQTITRPIEKLVLVTREIARGNFNLPVAQIVASNDEVGTLAMSFDAMLGGLRERDKVKSLFNKFHGSTVTDSLLASDSIATGGSRKDVVVFFSDIRGFTAISEASSPEQVVSMLNEYFGVMVNVILKNHGVVDKFIGDAIMAVWGVPHSTGDDAYHAVKACLEMRIALHELNSLRQTRGEQALMMGMGLHSGAAISGTIGSDERMEFTVIGDTVNMASRIEASTKAFGADLLLSAEIAEIVGERFILEPAGHSKVKGKAEALRLFKVRGWVGENGQQEVVKTPYSDYTPEAADKVQIDLGAS